MRSPFFRTMCASLLWMAGMTGAQVAGEAPAGTTPKAYALVAAIGDQFSVVVQKDSIGSHFEPFKRSRLTAPDNLLNLLALRGLDKALVQLEPDSRREYLSLPAAQVERVAAWNREEAVLAHIREQLQKNLPDRSRFQKILVATPAYRMLDHESLAAAGADGVRLQGFGIFTQPLAAADFDFGNGEIDLSVQGRTAARSPGKKEVKSQTYVAPFAYIEVWVLDARDLTVLDKQIRFDHQKLADPQSGVLDLHQSMSKAFLSAQMIGVIEGSLLDAVLHSEVNVRRGEVDIGAIRPARAPDGKR